MTEMTEKEKKEFLADLHVGILSLNGNSFDPFGPDNMIFPPSNLSFASLGIAIGFFPSFDIKFKTPYK